jgi:hypothetical protein
VVTTELDLSIEYPDSSFEIVIENRGLFDCGKVDWQMVEPSLQIGFLSCSPTNGILEGCGQSGESNTEEIRCSLDWSVISMGQAEDYFLVLFSYPVINGIDSAYLIHIHAQNQQE